jgi:predicted NBD/HSP70 family sugar kinase
MGPSLVRTLNLQAVLASVRDHGPITRADIARRTGLSPVTVSATIRLLIQQGFVREVGPTLTPQGKRATLLEFAGDARYVVAAVADGSPLTVACYDLGGHRLSEVRRAGVSDVDRLEAELPAMVWEALGERERRRLLAVGVAVSGTVDPQRGVVQESTLFRARQWPLGPRLSQALGGVPVRVENDGNALLVGDHYGRSRRGRAHVLAVFLNRGVGGALLLRGTVHHGHDHLAGELGALRTVGRDGSAATLEEVVGEPWLEERLRRAGERAADLSQVVAAPSDRARPVLEDAVERLVGAVVNACILVAPDEVVFSGRPWALELFASPLRRALADALPYPIPLRVLDDPVAAELAGAAALAMSVTPLTDPMVGAVPAARSVPSSGT